MTEVLTLDVNKQDDDLLVPFHRNPPAEGGETLFAQPKPTTANNSSTTFGRLFASFRNNNSNEQDVSLLDRDDFPEKEKSRRHADMQTTTFSFPNAPVEMADLLDSDEEVDMGPPTRFRDTNKRQAPPKRKQKQEEEEESDDEEEEESDDEEEEESDDEEEESDDEEEESDDEEESEEEEPRQRKRAEMPPPQRPYFSSYAAEEARPRSWRVEGFGNQPKEQQPTEQSGRFGGFFRMLSSSSLRNRTPEEQEREKERKSLRSMKVSTYEDKDKKTLSEQLTHAALVVMVPEIYAEEEDGEGNLGQYRAIRAEDHPVKKPDPITVMQKELSILKEQVGGLEKQLKSARLEATSWKVRAKELETQLRRYRGEDDNSSSPPLDEEQEEEEESEEEESEEEESEEEEKEKPAEDAMLLDMGFSGQETKGFDPLASTTTETKDSLLDLTAPPLEDAPRTELAAGADSVDFDAQKRSLATPASVIVKYPKL